MPHPQAEHADFLDSQDIKVVVSLTDEVPEWLHGEFETLHLAIEDFQPPTLLQQLRFVDAIERYQEDGVPVAVHCTAGRGRTGTMLATWFVADGMSSEQAIEHVRALRPGSIETQAQEAQIEAFAQFRAVQNTP
jgi:atypical dual specificity phosphatase